MWWFYWYYSQNVFLDNLSIYFDSYFPFSLNLLHDIITGDICNVCVGKASESAGLFNGMETGGGLQRKR